PVGNRPPAPIFKPITIILDQADNTLILHLLSDLSPHRSLRTIIDSFHLIADIPNDHEHPGDQDEISGDSLITLDSCFRQTSEEPISNRTQRHCYNWK